MMSIADSGPFFFHTHPVDLFFSWTPYVDWRPHALRLRGVFNERRG